MITKVILSCYATHSIDQTIHAIGIFPVIKGYTPTYEERLISANFKWLSLGMHVRGLQ